jgi:hypothetical protein
MSPLRRARHLLLPVLTLAAVAVLAAGCPEELSPEEFHSSRAYKGHENDIDIGHFVNTWPVAIGTRLDDCQTCHAGGSFSWYQGDDLRTMEMNACDFCHLVEHPRDPGFEEAQPSSYAQTLNPFGVDYLDAGRDRDALSAIVDDDSDGDGHANGVEIEAIRYPGDPASQPGQEVAPGVEFSFDGLGGLAQHEQLQLVNSHRQQFDFYATYRGVRVLDLLTDAGVDVASPDFAGITIIAPDGYLKDFDVDSIRSQAPAGLFYAGLDTATLGADCGFVEYPDVLPEGLVDGGEIAGEQWLIIGSLRDGEELEPSNLDITSGKLNGEGPYRLVMPQATPGMPDRGSNYSPTTCEDGHDYDDSFDHNAGAMVRGVVAIRTNPLPDGYEDFDYHYGGWSYVESRSLLVYGFGLD